MSECVDVHLVRHGKTWLNVLDRVQGWADTPLAPEGRRTAALIGRHFAGTGMHFDAAFSGDMVRHRETASLILAAMDADLAVTAVPGLREMPFGGFEGGPNAEMWEILLDDSRVHSVKQAHEEGVDYLDALDRLADLNPVPELETESIAHLTRRAVAAIDRIADAVLDAGHSRVLAVSSGITIACLVGALAGGRRGGVDNGAVAHLRRDEHAWQVLSYNDTSWADAEPAR